MNKKLEWLWWCYHEMISGGAYPPDGRGDSSYDFCRNKVPFTDCAKCRIVQWFNKILWVQISMDWKWKLVPVSSIDLFSWRCCRLKYKIMEGRRYMYFIWMHSMIQTLQKISIALMIISIISVSPRSPWQWLVCGLHC